ncbi:MAG: hypothetical protein AAF567_10805 [Actinomycetota bacterium]
MRLAGEPPPLRVSRAVIRLAIAVLLLLLAACTGSGEGADAEPTATAVVNRSADRAYDASWLVNAEAVGVNGPGFPFLYREVVDDASGRYLVQSPAHLATQDPEVVVFCAAIFRSDPYCASTERPDNTPPVLSYPVQLLRTWGPVDLYDLATWREVDLVAQNEPAAWRRTNTTIADTPVECFSVVGETSAARTGFEVCFTDDDLRLVASVDLQGDLVYEIDLRSYERTIADDAFETGLDEFIEAKQSLQDQLITLFPEIPAPRPTPTPDPDAEDDA